MECPICIEKIAPTRKVECSYCSFVACKKCTTTYILGTADDANCMNCKRSWNRETLIEKLSKSFVYGDYKRHRENSLLERETSMMPATQPHVEREIQRRKNVELLNTLNQSRNTLKRKLHEINVTITHLQNNINPPLDQERRAFLHKCGDPDCRGFLSTAWKCNICEKYTCNECNALKGADRDAPHTCDENDRLSMQAMRSECRKCPGCAQFIYKIDGCDQMWCVSCHTAFSWRTGAVFNGAAIHNPHFYEFQRTRGHEARELGDIPCGGMPSYRELSRALQALDQLIEYVQVFQIHRIALHVEHVELNRFNHAVTEQSNLNLRVKYMLNELTVDAFKSKIQQREKAAEKRRDITMILNMFVTLMSDFFRDMVHTKSIGNTLFEMRELINYTNRSIINVSKRYDCSVPYILTHPMFRITSATHRTF